MIKCAATDRWVFADGKEYDLPDTEARSMVNAGHAVPVDAPAAVTPPAEPPAIQPVQNRGRGAAQPKGSK